ncbi:ribosomal protein L22 (chloroplast) [Galdieria partita]|uniref:Large ribosomal subunit protein uL22c n=1 Tax=Galdieria partita TaxID=83374 RepID=A0A9C7BH04_9RHOD|nr:ribosomal protein L22 [Galdieria partita]
MQNNHSEFVKSVGKYIHTSPVKINRILNQIRNRTYNEALLILEFMPHKAAKIINKVVKSAGANAKHNFNLNTDICFIKYAYVDKGPILKRFSPRAQGRIYQIHKPSCHITIILGT